MTTEPTGTQVMGNDQRRSTFQGSYPIRYYSKGRKPITPRYRSNLVEVASRNLSLTGCSISEKTLHQWEFRSTLAASILVAITSSTRKANSRMTTHGVSDKFIYVSLSFHLFAFSDELLEQGGSKGAWADQLLH